MQLFASVMKPGPATTILDAGGTLGNWKYLQTPSRITLLNRDAMHAEVEYPANIKFQKGDALRMPHGDGSFDIAFSNSLIEHVHTWENQQRFAAEIRRVGKRVWVQTPAREFFLEPHLIAPFIHWLPLSWQRRLVRPVTPWGWLQRPTPGQVEDFLREVRLLSFQEMQQLFPDCHIHKERWLGMTKAYIAYSPDLPP